MYSSKVEASTTVNAPIQNIYDILTTPKKIPLIMPGLIENTNVSEMPLKDGSHFNYKYQLYGVMYEGTWTVVKAESPHYYEAKTDNPESHWTYHLDDQNGVTKIHVMVEYTAPEGVLQKIKLQALEVMNQKEVELFLHNLKILMEMQG